MNYGIDKEDLAFELDDLSMFTEMGYSFQRDENKTYIIHNGKLVSIVDNSTNLKDVKSIIHQNQSITGNFAYDDANREILGNFVSEIETKTGRQVDSVTFGPDGYDLVVDGEKVNVPYAENGSINIDDVTSRVSTKVTYKASDVLNDENKVVIEKYIEESLSSDCEVKLELNEEGKYEVIINGEKFTTLEKGATLSDAVKSVSDEFKSGKSISNYSADTTTNRLRAKTGQNYRVHIDVETMTGVQERHNKALEIMDGSKGDYKVNFTGKLATFYESVVGANTDPTKRIDKSVELLNNITMNVKYSLQAYENIDHELGMVFNSVVNDIFTMNTYADEETREFYNQPIEKRQEYLENLIDTYTKELDRLKAEFEEKYGEGILLDEDTARFIGSIIAGLHYNSSDTEVQPLGTEGKYVYHPEALERGIDFIIEHDVVGKLKAYSEGASWQDSGMCDFNSLISGSLVSYNEDRIYDSYDNDLCEGRFLNSIAGKNKDTRDYLENEYGSTDASDYIFTDGEEELRTYLKEKIREKLSKVTKVTTAEGEELELDPIQLADYYVKDRQEMIDSQNGLSNTIYNYKQYKDILPFEAEMQGEEYIKYLVQDYSSTDLKVGRYLDQREMALYQMYINTGRADKAAEYLVAMEDLINQRKGFEEAAETIMKFGGVDGFLLSGWEGLKNGFDTFFDGIINAFSPDGKRDASDYKNMYMLALLGEENIYTEGLSDVNRILLKENYSIMSSIGQQAIPTLAAFIPVVGGPLSMGLSGLSSFGNSVESAMQSGSSAGQAYLYGALSGVSTVVMNRCLSGIAGLNGNTEALTSFKGYLKSLPQQAARTLLGTYLDGGVRSVVLGEPFDISQLTEQGFDAAIQGAFSAAIMNGGNSLLLKVANGVTIKVSKGEYKSYKEFCEGVEKKMWDSSAGKKIKALKAAGGEKWEQYKANHPNSILVNMVDTYQYTHSPDMPINIDQETAAKMGITLKDGESLVYDPNSNNYQRIDSKGNHYNIPASDIVDYEGGMYIRLTTEEQKSLRLKQFGAEIIDTDENGNYIVEAASGDTYIVSPSEADSVGFLSQMEQIERVESTPNQSDPTMGMGSYEDLETACELTGITVEEYVRIAQTPERDLSDSELAAKFAVDDLLLQPYVDENGRVKPGTYIGKYMNRETFEKYYQNGEQATLGGCVGLRVDAENLSAEDGFYGYGLDYDGQKFKSDRGNYEMYYVEGAIPESIDPTGSGGVYRRISATAEGNPSNPDAWKADMDASADRMRSFQIVPDDKVRNEQASWNNKVGNPDLGQGTTLNQDKTGRLGAPEFYSEERQQVTNGTIWRVTARGKTAVGYIDSDGYIHLNNQRWVQNNGGK